MDFLKKMLFVHVPLDKRDRFHSLEKDKEIMNFFIYDLKYTREKFVDVIEKQTGTKFFETEKYPVSRSCMELITKEKMKEHRFFLFDKKNNEFQIACNMFLTKGYIEKVQNVCESFGIVGTFKFYFILNFDFDEILVKYETNELKPYDSNLNSVIQNKKENGQTSQPRSSVQKNTEPSDSDIIAKVNRMIDKGIKLNASDIHIEPIKKGLKVRYRVDGYLSVRDTFELPEEQVSGIINRFKIMASMDVGNRKQPQDGRIEIYKFKEKIFNMRVSTVLTTKGEKVVLRIFEENSEKVSLEELGFDKESILGIRNAVHTSTGVFIIAGGTGSGKSTTLNNMISQMDADERNIYTIEDPVEKNLDKVNQIQIDEKVGVNFRDILSALLRQDPDVISIGEIRDEETAALAFKASLTGHLVLSTVHSNSAHKGLGRLYDMKVKAYQLAAGLIGVLSQKLIRKTCPHCQSKRSLEEHEKKIIEKILTQYNGAFDHLIEVMPEKVVKANGCEKCNNIGYKGRTVVAEYLDIDVEIQEMIAKECTELEILNTSLEKGFKPMYVMAIEKLYQHQLTFEEFRSIL